MDPFQAEELSAASKCRTPVDSSIYREFSRDGLILILPSGQSTRAMEGKDDEVTGKLESWKSKK